MVLVRTTIFQVKFYCNYTIRQEMFAMKESGRRITLNVRGCRYETFQETLEEFPETLLGSEEKRRRFYDPLQDEYFLERDKCAFDAILFYYQSRGILSRPATVPANAFDEELKFYEIRKEKPVSEQEGKMNVMPDREWQRKMWQLLEYPESSRQAALFAKLSMVVIVLSIVVFCVETLDMASTIAVKSLSSRNNTNNNTLMERERDKLQKRPRVWFVIDTCIIVWFTFEYAARLVSAPEKIKFVMSTLALIDLTAIIPYFLTLFLGDDYAPAFSFTIMRIFRLLRVIRLLKLTRYVAALKILGYTVRSCQEQLTALIFLIFISVVLFSSTIYYLENKDNSEQFDSIPASLWWAIVTMTTVGYGDMAPVTPFGRIVGALCAIFGVVVMVCLPSPVFISSFNDIYMRHIGQLRKKSKQIDADDSSLKVKKNWRSAIKPSNILLIRKFCGGQED